MTASRTPTLAEVLRRAMDRRVADLRVSLPARVTRYDASKRLCDAHPLLRETYTDADDKPMNVSLPVVTNVPVVFPGAGGFSVTFPVEPGDIVLLVFADRSLDRWLSMGGEVDPIDPRRHALSDAVAIPGLQPFVNAVAADADAMVVGDKDGAHIEIRRDGDVRLNGGTSSVARVGDAVSAGTSMQTWIAAVSTATGAPLPTDFGAVSQGAPNVKA